MEYIIISLLVITVLLLIAILISQGKNKGGKDTKSIENKVDQVRASILDYTSITSSDISRQRDSITNQMNMQMGAINKELSDIRQDMIKTLSDIKETNTKNLLDMRRDNQASMDKINDTVNEKLQKTLDDRISKSFESVRNQLAEVYKGLGEMREVASNVTDLKKVLANVKTRGIVGEVQLEAILSEILTKDQYVSQYKVNPRNSDMVDFAIKLPGVEDNDSDYVFLPIDSKFPGETYNKLMDAYETSDVLLIRDARKALETTIKQEARSIHDKYIIPPHTTDFAVMFLPFEGLYAEVVNMGLIDELQQKYRINVAGPSTMAAMLSSFRMGFRTLAIQKRSGEVWKTLESVKLEFSNFEDGLNKMKKRLTQVDDELEFLIGRRTNAINRKLRDISVSDSTEPLLQQEE